jgi:hypothetical protein
MAKRAETAPVFLLVGLILLAACTTPAAGPKAKPAAIVEPSAIGPTIVGGITPMQPQPAPGDVVPGLSTIYFRMFKARDLANLPRGDFARELGRPGTPIPYLNHDFGKGEVFDSGEKILIGMRMLGMLRFPESGRYEFKAYVNDGVLLYLADQLVLDEPKWNKEGDRYTMSAAVDVSADLWYPLMIEYFQRKGTATLKLYWRKPRQHDFEIVPAKAFAHVRQAS